MQTTTALNSNLVMFSTMSEGEGIYKPEYIFTNDLMFGIRIHSHSRHWDSNYLYINSYAITDPASPLSKLMEDGMIIQVPDYDTIRKKTNYKEDPIELYYKNTDGVLEKIPGMFYKCRFFRKLIDKRYSKTGARVSGALWETSLNENDCLNFAEFSTMRQTDRTCELPYNYKTSVLQSKDNGRAFGVSDEDNIELLQNIPLKKSNNNASPLQGESYAIVRNEIKPGTMYHIAYCIYQHNNVNITLEANADSGREYLPTFNMYDVNPRGFTFHKRYSDLYDNSKTIVLQSRNISVVQEEIIQEKTELERETEVGKRKLKYK